MPYFSIVVNCCPQIKTNPISRTRFSTFPSHVDQRDIAEVFNDFFITKISNLKENININNVEDPLSRLEEQLKSKNQILSFSLKTVSEKVVANAIKSLRSKKSCGADELTQEQMKLGADKLGKPLTKIYLRE